ncbi:hypothetical protein ACLB2K_048893 [Fragaria x ananassa]
MAFPRLRLSQRLVVVAIVALFCAMAIDYVEGILIDQGIACVLMLLALVLTYLIHDSDLPKIEWMKE